MKIKPIAGYEQEYEVSEDGRVFSIPRPITRANRFSSFTYIRKKMELSQILNKNGYFVVSLSKKGLVKQWRINRLVAEAFIPNPKKLPQVNHKDSNRKNNLVSNLEWVTARENCIHASRFGNLLKGENNPSSKLTSFQVKEIRRLYRTGKYTLKKIASIFHVHFTTIGYIVTRKAWQHI